MNSNSATKSGRSHSEILKSTALMGGASVVNIAVGIVRSKVIALLLGPSGTGLISVFNSIIEITQALSNLGVQSSGVRQIAEAAAASDSAGVARTATVLRRASIFFALIGTCLLAGLSGLVSDLSFGDRSQSFGVAFLAIAVFFNSVSAGQGALIQGMRRIADLARMNILAALTSTGISIVFISLLGKEGIVLSLVAMAAASALMSWWFSRRLQVRSISMSLSEMLPEVTKLLKLGTAFTATAVLTAGVAYAIRIIILQRDGVAAAGLYQAAWTLGGLYTGFILQAMGTDFYPRLTGVWQNNAECNRLVNEQAYISMLIAGPGIVATLTLAPFVMTVFYSSEFQSSVGLVRWICLGMMLRIIAWPMGFIALAKGAQQVVLWTELWAAIVHVGLAWVFVNRLGFEGAGIAFFALYISHSIIIYLVVRRLSGFRWSSANLRLGMLLFLSAAMTFCSFYLFPFWYATAIGLGITIFSGIYSIVSLLKICTVDMLPVMLKPWLGRFT